VKEMNEFKMNEDECIMRRKIFVKLIYIRWGVKKNEDCHRKFANERFVEELLTDNQVENEREMRRTWREFC
jgi:hypothetical protein